MSQPHRKEKKSSLRSENVLACGPVSFEQYLSPGVVCVQKENIPTTFSKMVLREDRC